MGTQRGALKLTPKKEKILASVLYLIQEQPGITQYEINKALFLADKRHLNEYGRPVTFDNYVAMPHGPVPSFAYNMTKPDFDFFKNLGIKTMPWVVTVEKGNILHFDKTAFKPDLEELSETDIESLDGALEIIRALTFSQLRSLTHEDPAYKIAWSRRGKRSQHPIELEDLLELSRDEIEDICHVISMA